MNGGDPSQIKKWGTSLARDLTCEPLVSLPRLAMTSRPSRSTGFDRSSSANVPPSDERRMKTCLDQRAALLPKSAVQAKGDAQIDSPPVPLCFVKSPP